LKNTSGSDIDLNKSRILSIVGTRPEIIKMAPVIDALDRMSEVDHILVHSGQHYDLEMSAIFFDELGIRKPDTNLRVGSGTQAQQTSRMLTAYEKMIARFDPDLILAEGDTNTVVAASLGASKLGVPFGHVESGLRSYDRRMPEEINRVVADHCAQLCFAPTWRSMSNLLYEGIPPRRIFVTGNTVVDSCLKYIEKARMDSRIIEKLDIAGEKPLVLVTTHRVENVESRDVLRGIVRALRQLSESTIVWPVHPRTKRKLIAFRLLHDLKSVDHISLIDPLGYLDFLRLLSTSTLVLTDSGGVQEEALTLRVPCLTLRHSTERPETVDAGVNIVVGTETGRIVAVSKRLLRDPEALMAMKVKRNPLGDGKGGIRIASICFESCKSGILIESPSYYESGSAQYGLIRIGPGLVGKTVKTVESISENIQITSVYLRDGRPVLPSPDLMLKRGHIVRVFGSPLEIQKLRNLSPCGPISWNKNL